MAGPPVRTESVQGMIVDDSARRPLAGEPAPDDLLVDLSDLTAA